jgi:hypothetical protein
MSSDPRYFCCSGLVPLQLDQADQVCRIARGLVGVAYCGLWIAGEARQALDTDPRWRELARSATPNDTLQPLLQALDQVISDQRLFLIPNLVSDSRTANWVANAPGRISRFVLAMPVDLRLRMVLLIQDGIPRSFNETQLEHMSALCSLAARK